MSSKLRMQKRGREQGLRFAKELIARVNAGVPPATCKVWLARQMAVTITGLIRSGRTRADLIAWVASCQEAYETALNNEIADGDRRITLAAAELQGRSLPWTP